MKQKIMNTVSIFLLTGFLGACTSSTAIVKAQNDEIMKLQEIRAEILARPATTPKEKLAKAADLKMINNQIDQSMKTAAEAQKISNEQTSNTIKGVLTGAGTVIGGAVLIHDMTK